MQKEEERDMRKEKQGAQKERQEKREEEERGTREKLTMIEAASSQLISREI